MSFATRMQQTARTLLTKYGQAVSGSRDINSNFVPADGTVTVGTPLTYTGVCYPSNYNQNQIDGTIIQQDDILIILRTDTEPKVNDVLTTGGKAYTIINMQIVTAQGLDIIYKCQVRQ